LVNEDAATFLTSYSFSGTEFVYADPPYLPQTRRRSRVYRFDYGPLQHEELLKVLNAIPCRVMVSGYENAMYNDLLRHWRKMSFAAKTHVEVREECVWFNFDPPSILHDGSYLGDGFRGRQTIRRRHIRLLEKFGQMELRERHHLIETLNARFGVPAGRP
jgi:ribosomal protein L39E